MYTVKKNLQDAYNRLENIIKMLERKLSSNSVRIQEIMMRSNIEDLLLDMISSLKECVKFGSKDFSFNIERDEHLLEFVTKTYESFENLIKDKPIVENSSDVTTEEYYNLLSELYKNFNLNIEIVTKDAFFNSGFRYDMETKMDEVWDGSADFLDLETIKSIIGLIDQPRNHKFTLLDMNVGSANNYVEICNILEDKADIYGISDYDYLTREIKQAREKSKKVIINGLKNATISNDSFDVTLVFANIHMNTYSRDSYLYNELLAISPEQYYARRAFTYARPGGIVMYAIPFTRLSKGICVDLARNLENVHAHIWRKEYDSCGMVLIVGNKKLRKTKFDIGNVGVDNDTYKMLREIVIAPEKYEVVDSIANKFSLPTEAKEIKIFRGSKLEDFELLEMINDSTAMKEFWKKQSVEKISEQKRHSLLPFNTGQIGLVLTSGCLDGVINEGNGCSHIVKGRVVKMKDEQHVPEPENHVVIVSEKTSNRVEINAFLPNGEYKKLA